MFNLENQVYCKVTYTLYYIYLAQFQAIRPYYVLCAMSDDLRKTADRSWMREAADRTKCVSIG